MPRGDKSSYTDKQERQAEHSGEIGGKAAAKRPAAERSRSAKKAAQTRKRIAA